MRATSPEETELALYALLCWALLRAGGVGQADLLATDEAVRGLQLLAEIEDLGDLLSGNVVAQVEVAWARYGPKDIPFDQGWVSLLKAEHRHLLEALSFATATVNYWQLKQGG